MSEITKNKKIAIVLFNLGGPDKLGSVKPFLFNLFFDKNIITLPVFFRYFIAKIISSRREKIAKEIYKNIGGKSPIIEETQKQINSLKEELKSSSDLDFEIFMCMRHWHPMSDEVVEKIKQYSPDEVILLPLYPQFSTTTTGSSIEDFTSKMKQKKLNVPCKTICCYPGEENFLKAHAELITNAIDKIKDKNNYKILFSAHGLPQKIVDSGDPYQWQIENTVESIIKLLNIKKLDYKITYQSRVGPLEWLKPDTEEEIKKVSAEKKEIVIVPIAFVSEHVETLVELDIEYKEIAKKHDINYVRVPTLSINELFIKSLSEIIIRSSKKEGSFILSSKMIKTCPGNFGKCPCKS